MSAFETSSVIFDQVIIEVMKVKICDLSGFYGRNCLLTCGGYKEGKKAIDNSRGSPLAGIFKPASIV